MRLFLKLLSIFLVPLLAFSLMGQLSALISSASGSFSTSYTILLVISVIALVISYIIQRFVYPLVENKLEFERKFQQKWIGGVFPYFFGFLVSLPFLYFFFESCNFYSGCKPVTATIRALFSQISNNGLYFRKPHIEGFSYLGMFLGLLYSLSLVTSEVIFRIIFAVKLYTINE